MFREFQRLIPKDLGGRSGKVFYSGRDSFSGPSDLYVLGLNPGGTPEAHPNETIASHVSKVASVLPADWSAYRDESWEGSPPGSWGMQPGVLLMFRQLGRNPGTVPCSNLVFPRSRGAAELKHELPGLVEQCWPFHAAALKLLRPRAVVCFGQDAGKIVCQRTGARQIVGEFVEANQRRWPSRTYQTAGGLKVVVVTHPSRADWHNPAANPTPLVVAALP
jgi:Uracil DNA glycosylase superfamily